MNATIYNTTENTKNAVFFVKEDIGKLTFSKEDVLLNDKEQQNERLQRLTTIGGIAEKYILLKGAIILPIKCTLKIIFY